ncbi:hypothetical protein RhiJN_06094 [Ceratobasidium sp. AG-Ba]|nr:hypothetical protein RhiJN_06094 [Ceratobasidium sp. AG-Ba]QRW07045.1 hypothetical protein RhiLY_06044 [Ceratobasidium sp. AG-Ba]
MFSKSFIAAVVAAVVGAVGVAAESHTITFINKCGSGTPTIVNQTGKVVSTGNSYTINGSFVGGRAFLVNGACKLYGVGCTVVEMTLDESHVSAADISLISPFAFSTPAAFAFKGGCDGASNSCTSAKCCPTGAYCTPADDQATRACTAKNVGLEITFC